LLKIFLPPVSWFRKEEDDPPAYFESERKHVAPSECENQQKSVKVKAVPSMGDLGWF